MWGGGRGGRGWKEKLARSCVGFVATCVWVDDVVGGLQDAGERRLWCVRV